MSRKAPRRPAAAAVANSMSSSSWASPGTSTATRHVSAIAPLSTAAARAIVAAVAGRSTPLPVAFRQRSRSRRGGSMLLLAYVRVRGPAVTICPLARSRQNGQAVWIQRQIELRARPRGFHLVTEEIVGDVPELSQLAVGIATLFMQHTSASLTLNENASPDVRRDFSTWFDDAVPDGWPAFSHRLEGPDDMPAHIKASLTGASLVLPVSKGRLALGTWQGIYLCEHRDRGGPRRVVFTALGDEST